MKGARGALLAVGTEPLPARFVPLALAQLERESAQALKGARLAYASLRTFGTARRLVVLIEGLAETSEPLVKEAFGPSARVLRDEQGNFTPQALGFARAHGLKPEELEVGASTRGEVLVARKKIAGESAFSILARLWPAVIGALRFPKSMEWEASRFRFARPIRGLTALFGTRIVPFELAGVRSGRKAWGRMAAGLKPLAISQPSAYLGALRAACVLADHQERRQALLKALGQATEKADCVIEEDAELVEETTFLTEYPSSVLGAFPADFLDLPEELIVTVLKKQLKFFPVREKAGRLLNRFVGIRDGISEGQREIREGYERVVVARLDDAAFYVQQDLKRALGDMRRGLKEIQFHPRLGSQYDKSLRVAALAEALCEALRQDNPVDEPAARRIAELGYADLASAVIREFPELQGRIGGQYARRAGMDERLALGLSEFYFPVTARSPIPTTLEGCVAALAAKLDTLAGDFCVGLAPSGSEDPHGLRRQAQGAVRILIERQLAVDLWSLVDRALELQPVPEEARLSARALLKDFLDQRLKGVLEEAGFAFDEIRAVVDGAALRDRILPRLVKRIAALHAFRAQPEFNALAAAFKRASNILKGVSSRDATRQPPDPALFSEEAEGSLFEGLHRARGEMQLRLQDGEFEDCLRILVRLKPEVDRFFEKVLVMAEDTGLRENRLSLLSDIVGLFNSVADLSQLQ